MGMPLSQTEWTADMLDALPDDGQRYEVIDGELFVTPAPANVHQRAIAELYLLLAPYAKRVGIEALFAPAAIRWSQRREVQPDLFATPLMPDGRPPERFTDVGVLLLAVEVLSPSTRRTDRHNKRALYQEEGVPDYWIVDTDSRSVELWRPGATVSHVSTTTLEWQPVSTHEPLVINVAEYFRCVCGRP